jgi:hypothetical protein
MINPCLHYIWKMPIPLAWPACKLKSRDMIADTVLQILIFFKTCGANFIFSYTVARHVNVSARLLSFGSNFKTLGLKIIEFSDPKVGRCFLMMLNCPSIWAMKHWKEKLATLTLIKDFTKMMWNVSIIHSHTQHSCDNLFIKVHKILHLYPLESL